MKQFEHLFKALFGPLCAFSSKMISDSDAAKSIVHDVFISLWEKFETLPADTNYRSYLYAGVRNRSLNHLRDRKKFVAIESVAQSEVVRDSHPLEATELEIEIEIGIQSLPDRCREIFELNRKDGLRYAQIAEMLGLSVKTVEAQMSKALQIMRERLKEFLTIIFFMMY